MTRAPARRSQEERSAATRERLLDATIGCLVDLGYAGTTTTEIVRRAGVSRGAQVHHFPTKGELVQEAVLHLARRQQEAIGDELTRPNDKNGDRVSQAIDALWSAYTGPLFTAALELIVAARTDPALRPGVEALQADLHKGVETYCRQNLSPEVLKRRSFRDAIELTADVMHGLALAGMFGDERVKQQKLLETWKKIVRPLLEGALAKGDKR